jgi:hypothetical protein
MALLYGLGGAAGGAVVGLIVGRPFIGLCCAASGFVVGLYNGLKRGRSNPN